MTEAPDKLLITGGAGFIGSAVVRLLMANSQAHIVNVDKLTYAGNPEAVQEFAEDPRYVFEQVDICDGPKMAEILSHHRPGAIMHLAAESHVDRSIDGAAEFIQTNIVGTYTLLEVARRYWEDLEQPARGQFRFHHVSTDEVFGSLGPQGAFTEQSPYRPNSPYSASKASADHLVRAWNKTFGLPVVLTNCSNNYGPNQFPEKLIPLMIANILENKPLPVYGTGSNVRDWLYVEDHARALLLVLARGQIGETYNIGGGAELTNIDLVERLCDLLDELAPHPDGPHRRLITFVTDRPGHDLRYAIDCRKIEEKLGWRPHESFDSGLRKTALWYMENRDWWQRIRAGVYDGKRLGSAREPDVRA